MRKLAVSLVPVLVPALVALGPVCAAAQYLRGVPYFDQARNTLNPGGSCQNTCMAMVLRYFGADDVTPDRISERWGTEKAQTVAGWQEVFNTLAGEHGLLVRDRGAGSGRLSELLRSLDQRLPVVVHGGFTPSGHLVVLLGRDEEYYYLHDPSGTGQDAGRHVRYTRERVEAAVCDPLNGQVRFHSFSLEPGPLSARLEDTAPDSVVLGEPFALAATVHVSTQVAGAAPPSVTADLTGLGGPARLPLPALGDGRYGLSAELSGRFEAPGRRSAVVTVEQRAGDRTYSVPLALELTVLPVAGQTLFADQWDAGWGPGPVLGASLAEVTAGPVHAGAASLAVRAEGDTVPQLAARLFMVQLRPAQPVSVAGYQALRFAFHPGDAVAVGAGRLALFVNGDLRTATFLVGGPRPLVDLSDRQWQSVDLPIVNLAYIEKPVESIGLAGELHGTLYLDDVHLSPARPCPVSASWEIAPPDTVLAGAELRLAARVRLDRWALEGQAPRLTADLSGLGGPSDLPLAADGGGYPLRAAMVPGPRNGLRRLAVRVEQQVGGQPYALELARPVIVLPAADEVIYADGFGPNWRPGAAYRATLDPAASAPVYAGGAALAAAVDGFTIDLEAVDPVEPVGYRALRLAFHPGGAQGGAKPAFNVMVNGDPRTAVVLLGRDSQWPPIDLSRQEWQEVEIPLAAFGAFDGPVGSIRLLGNLRGRFALDEVRLVAARQPAIPTAVLEPTALPGAFALAQNHPNPFNGATAIAFALASPGWVDLEVFDLLGQRVRVLAAGVYRAGTHVAVWDGCDAQGRPAASGTYLYRLRTTDRTAARRMLLLR